MASSERSQVIGTQPAAPVVADIEYELTMLSRHHLHARRHRPNQVLDQSAYVLLSRLELQSPMSLKELAEAFRLDLSTINRQVGALISKGLVERVLDPNGGVARKVRATALGLEQLNADRAVSCQGVGRIVTGWTDDDLESLRELLTRFNVDIENLEGVRWPRPAERTAQSDTDDAER